MKNKVYHFSKYSVKTFGGVESVLRGILNSDSKFHHESYCFENSKNQKNINNEVFCKINFKILKQPLSFKYSILFIYFNFLKQRIVIHHPNLNLFLLCFVLFINPNVSIFWHADPLPNVKNNIFISYLINFLNFFSYRVKNIYTTSPHYAQSSKFLVTHQKKIIILPLFSDKNIVRYRNFSPISSFNLVFIGRLVHYKGLLDLLHIFPDLPKNVSLNIIGDGPLKYKICELINDSNLKDRIFIHNSLTDNEVKSILSKSNLLVLPSITRQEAFGVVLLEAMCNQVPFLIRFVEGSGMNYVFENSIGNYRSESISVNSFRKVLLLAINKESIKSFNSNLTNPNLEFLNNLYNLERFIKNFEKYL